MYPKVDMEVDFFFVEGLTFKSALVETFGSRRSDFRLAKVRLSGAYCAEYSCLPLTRGGSRPRLADRLARQGSREGGSCWVQFCEAFDALSGAAFSFQQLRRPAAQASLQGDRLLQRRIDLAAFRSSLRGGTEAPQKMEGCSGRVF